MYKKFITRWEYPTVTWRITYLFTYLCLSIDIHGTGSSPIIWTWTRLRTIYTLHSTVHWCTDCGSLLGFLYAIWLRLVASYLRLLALSILTCNPSTSFLARLDRTITEVWKDMSWGYGRLRTQRSQTPFSSSRSNSTVHYRGRHSQNVQVISRLHSSYIMLVHWQLGWANPKMKSRELNTAQLLKSPFSFWRYRILDAVKWLITWKWCEAPGQARHMLFGGGARFDLAAPRSRPLVGYTRILLSLFHHGMGSATVLKVGYNVACGASEKIGFQVHTVRMFGLRVGVNPSKQKELHRSRIGLWVELVKQQHTKN